MTTLIADPQVVAIPVIDDGEPLIDLHDVGVRCADAGGPVQRPGAGHVRLGVARRLVRADAALPPDLHLLVVEGWRPAAEQQRVIDGYRQQLRVARPEADAAEIHRLSSRYVAPLEVAPHVVGAAVDLTLADARGRRVWMGCELDATPEESDGACAFDAPGIDPQARRHRDLLAAVLRSAGLVNYPTEWWHWSYGDRYWAHVTGAAHALYGPVGPEDSRG